MLLRSVTSHLRPIVGEVTAEEEGSEGEEGGGGGGDEDALQCERVQPALAFLREQF